jgi:hypothetical protein
MLLLHMLFNYRFFLLFGDFVWRLDRALCLEKLRLYTIV